MLTDRAVLPDNTVSVASPFSGHAQQIAHSAILFRERRREVLGINYFADPAWDLLLYLTAHDNADGYVTCEFVAGKTGVSPAVVERFALLLQMDGMVEVQDRAGGKVVKLTKHGFQSLLKLII